MQSNAQMLPILAIVVVSNVRNAGLSHGDSVKVRPKGELNG